MKLLANFIESMFRYLSHFDIKDFKEIPVNPFFVSMDESITFTAHFTRVSHTDGK